MLHYYKCRSEMNLYGEELHVQFSKQSFCYIRCCISSEVSLIANEDSENRNFAAFLCTKIYYLSLTVLEDEKIF